MIQEKGQEPSVKGMRSNGPAATSTFIDISAVPKNFNGRILHVDPRYSRRKQRFQNMMYGFFEFNKSIMTLSPGQLCCKVPQKRLLSY
jgi:hypothetical protein